MLKKLIDVSKKRKNTIFCLRWRLQVILLKALIYHIKRCESGKKVKNQNFERSLENHFCNFFKFKYYVTWRNKGPYNDIHRRSRCRETPASGALDRIYLQARAQPRPEAGIRAKLRTNEEKLELVCKKECAFCAKQILNKKI